MTIPTEVAAVLAEMRELKVPNWPAVRILGDLADRIESALASSAEPAVKYTTGHCKNKAQPGGCQLHNLQCGYPSCDREPIQSPSVPVESLGRDAPGYGLSDEQVATLLAEGLKPEEIGGSAELQHARVGELVHWFARLATKSANPKWAVSHAFELAYFVATSAGNRHIDLKLIRDEAYKQGAMVSPADRGMLERIGFLQPMPAPPPASVPDGWLPIESVPKSVADGQRVGGIYLLGYVPDADVADPAACIDIIWWEPLLPNNRGSRGKWCASKFGDDCEVSPTHWQPLPPPPANQEGAAP